MPRARDRIDTELMRWERYRRYNRSPIVFIVFIDFGQFFKTQITNTDHCVLAKPRPFDNIGRAARAKNLTLKPKRS
jgi:hypothetical protein